MYVTCTYRHRAVDAIKHCNNNIYKREIVIAFANGEGEGVFICIYIRTSIV